MYKWKGYLFCYCSLAVIESPAWRFASQIATQRMNNEIIQFWRCYNDMQSRFEEASVIIYRPWIYCVLF